MAARIDTPRQTGHDTPVWAIDGARTPFIKARGVPGPFTAADLAVAAGKPLLLRLPFPAAALDEVILGCVMPSPAEANIARVVSLRLGCGNGVTAWTVGRNCGSGLQALDAARQRIASGQADLVLAGGVEAMSQAPVSAGRNLLAWLGRWRQTRGWRRIRLLPRFRWAMLQPTFALPRGLTDPVTGLSMGQTAENLAFRFGITREAMDALALASHGRLAAAQDEHRLVEVQTIYDAAGNAYTQDDGLRRDTDAARLAALKPAFEAYGLVSAGNSAQVTDGAAWLLLASNAAVERYGLPVLGRLVDCRWAGVSPAEMGLGPAHAVPPLLAAHGLTPQDIHFWEINEAFAAQILAVLAAWRDRDYCRDVLGLTAPFGEIPADRLNVDGGAIALGHPVGASGARIVLHLLDVLRRSHARRGIAALCIGGGQGGAMLIERTSAGSLKAAGTTRTTVRRRTARGGGA